MAEPRERLGEVGVVDVAAGPAQQVAVEDQDPHEAIIAGWSHRNLPRDARPQTYRLRAPASGREALVEADVDGVYVDRETRRGAASRSPASCRSLPPTSALLRTPENLRECRRCEQLIGIDVSDCPHCGLRQEPPNGEGRLEARPRRGRRCSRAPGSRPSPAAATTTRRPSRPRRPSRRAARPRRRPTSDEQLAPPPTTRPPRRRRRRSRPSPSRPAPRRATAERHDPEKPDAEDNDKPPEPGSPRRPSRSTASRPRRLRLGPTP